MKWIWIIFAAGAVSAQAATYYVATNGNDSTGDGSADTPWLTISNALSNAGEGDTVLVSNGVYWLTNQVSITYPVSLRGQDRTNTIIQGQFPDFTNRGLYITSAGATVDEFTVTGFGVLTNNSAYANRGGGVYMTGGTLQNCIISSNRSYMGGGVYQLGGLVSNCVVRLNRSGQYDNGGGINSANEIRDCFIADNYAAAKGGGVSLGSGALLAGCVVSNNASFGGGGGVYANGGIISNCTVVTNKLTANNYGGGIHCLGGSAIYGSFIRNNDGYYGGGVCSYDGNQVIRDSEIAGNKAGRGGGIQLRYGSLLLTNCVVSNNASNGGSGIDAGMNSNYGVTALWCRVVNNTSAYGNGGVWIWKNSMLDHCHISDNTGGQPGGGGSGGGVCLKAGGNGAVRNCLVNGNRAAGASAPNGGGIYIETGATNQISACTVADNYAVAAGGRGGGVYFAGDGGVTFSNCVIASNTSAIIADRNICMATAGQTDSFYYCCSELLSNAEQGNITYDPIFAAPSAGDFRMAAESPCVNAGTNEPWMAGDVALDGNIRVDRVFRHVDMGCYEYLPQILLIQFK